LKRPLGLKLILIYNLLLLCLIIHSIILYGWGLARGGVIGILYLLALYYGLWKMRRDWMFVFLFITILSTFFHLFIMIFADISYILIVFFNILSIYWLYTHRNIFIKPKGKSAVGTLDEWLRLALIIIGIVLVPLGILIYNIDYAVYAFLFIPIWIVFVWFFIPKIYKKTKRK